MSKEERANFLEGKRLKRERGKIDVARRDAKKLKSLTKSSLMSLLDKAVGSKKWWPFGYHKLKTRHTLRRKNSRQSFISNNLSSTPA